MKEAAGEANMTVITIVLIAIVLGVGLIIVPRMMNKTSERACCTNSGGVWATSRGEGCYKASECKNVGGVTNCTNATKITPKCE